MKMYPMNSNKNSLMRKLVKTLPTNGIWSVQSVFCITHLVCSSVPAVTGAESTAKLREKWHQSSPTQLLTFADYLVRFVENLFVEDSWQISLILAWNVFTIWLMLIDFIGFFIKFSCSYLRSKSWFFFSGRYLQMMTVLKPIAFDVTICMSQLFDYYLFSVYLKFLCFTVMTDFFFNLTDLYLFWFGSWSSECEY